MTTLTHALAIACLAASGCAAVPAAPDGDAMALRLQPAALGRELALQQRMTVTVKGCTQQLDVALEVDRDAVRLAVLDLGHTLARLEWNGRELTESRAAGWPAAVSGQHVLTDLQLVYWPPEAIRPALPAGWSLQVDGDGRTVRSPASVAWRVRYPAPGAAELENVGAGYALRLESWQGPR